MIASFGLLEWSFVGLLVTLVGLVSLASLYFVVQLFRNPARTRS